MLCDKFRLKESDILDHSEGYRRGIASNHSDVMHWFVRHGVNLNSFRAAVKQARESNINVSAIEEENMTQTEFNKMFQVAVDDYNKKTAALPVSAWAREYWDKLTTEGVFDGTMPQSPITREQAAAVISRVMKK